MSRRGQVAGPAVAVALGGAAVAAWLTARSKGGRSPVSPVHRTGRTARNLALAKLGVSVGSAFATTKARQVFASAERSRELDEALKLRSAEQIAERLGNMKGAFMKLGQMASYLDGGLPEPMRQALAQLQADAPPMTAELAASVIRDELGADPDDLFVEWDPEPIAAASIGQVHRAIWRDPSSGIDRAVAVKVQYPGVGEAIRADLANLDVLGLVLRQGFGSFDPTEMVEEIRERLGEELDYAREAQNQRAFAAFYAGHPFIRIPAVVDELSSRKVLTSELAVGATWEELLTWDQRQRDLAAESIYRFVFRSLYRMRAFNGDPHPGNYLFHGDGIVTFLDFGLVRYFEPEEMTRFLAMVKAAVVDHDVAEYRRIVTEAGLLVADAPVDTDEVGRYFRHFYEAVSTDREVTWTPEYASSVVRHTFDRNSPIAAYATVPRSFVFIQRINLGLYALLGALRATGNWRRIVEEIWPFSNAGPSTAMGEAEARWIRRQHPTFTPPPFPSTTG